MFSRQGLRHRPGPLRRPITRTNSPATQVRSPARQISSPATQSKSPATGVGRVRGLLGLVADGLVARKDLLGHDAHERAAVSKPGEGGDQGGLLEVVQASVRFGCQQRELSRHRGRGHQPVIRVDRHGEPKIAQERDRVLRDRAGDPRLQVGRRRHL